MSDARIRDLERHAAAGDPSAEEALRAIKQRTAPPPESRYTPLAATVEAIDAWMARTASEGRHYGVDIRTKSGSWRCITHKTTWDYTDRVIYWTIRAEGKSSAGRDTGIDARHIVAARGWVV